MSTRAGTPAPDVEIIGESAPEVSRDEWLVRIKRNSADTPRVLSVPASQLVAEARAEAE